MIQNGHYYLDPAHLYTSIPLAVGGIFWITTYVLIIRRSFRDQAYGIPMLAICLNITWEALTMAACVPSGDPMGLCPKPEGGGMLGLAETAGVLVDVAWFGLDCILIYQLFRFGPRVTRIPHLRRHWAKYVVIALAFSLALQHGFVRFYDDVFLIRDAWIINMVMSLSFIYLYFDRHPLGLVGLSWAAAWTKLAGNAMYALGLTIVHLQSTSEHIAQEDSGWFMYVLFALTLFFDMVYIGQLSHHRRHRAAHPAVSEPLPA